MQKLVALRNQKKNKSRNASRQSKSKTKQGRSTAGQMIRQTGPTGVLNSGDWQGLSAEDAVGGTLKGSQEFIKYARIYSDPFSSSPARIPIHPSIPSQVLRVYIKGTGMCNANGNGWVACSAGRGIMSDQNSVNVTTSGFSSDNVALGGTGTALLSSNSNYLTSQFLDNQENSGLAMRPVAVGLRFAYTGSTLNAAGRAYCLQESPRCSAIDVGGLNPSLIAKFPGFKEYPFSERKWVSVTRHVQETQDLWYQNWSNANNGLQYDIFRGNSGGAMNSNDNQYNMILYATGCAANTPFEFEYVAHYEVIGVNLVDRKITTLVSGHDPAPALIGGYAKLRHKDSTTPDHSVGKDEGSSGGWLSIIKKGFEFGVPLVASIIKNFAI